MDTPPSRRVLLLNADYKPKDILSWRKAIEMVYKESVWVLANYEDWVVRSISVSITVPAVLLLRDYVKWHKRVSFNRTNIYIRDDFSCLYCGKSARARDLRISDLTYDHVIPKSKGGQTTWDNIVTACRTCNHRKADRLPREAKMPLQHKPYEPTNYNGIEYSLAGKRIPEVWKDYLAPEALELVSS